MGNFTLSANKNYVIMIKFYNLLISKVFCIVLLVLFGVSRFDTCSSCSLEFLDHKYIKECSTVQF